MLILTLKKLVVLLTYMYTNGLYVKQVIYLIKYHKLIFSRLHYFAYLCVIVLHR